MLTGGTASTSRNSEDEAVPDMEGASATSAGGDDDDDDDSDCPDMEEYDEAGLEGDDPVRGSACRVLKGSSPVDLVLYAMLLFSNISFGVRPVFLVYIEFVDLFLAVLYSCLSDALCCGSRGCSHRHRALCRRGKTTLCTRARMICR